MNISQCSHPLISTHAKLVTNQVLSDAFYAIRDVYLTWMNKLLLSPWFMNRFFTVARAAAAAAAAAVVPFKVSAQRVKHGMVISIKFMQCFTFLRAEVAFLCRTWSPLLSRKWVPIARSSDQKTRQELGRWLSWGNLIYDNRGRPPTIDSRSCKSIISYSWSVITERSHE